MENRKSPDPAAPFTHWLRAFFGNTADALTIPLLATLAGLIVGTIFILIAGKDPVEAYKALFAAVAGRPRNFGETLVTVIPLIFTGLAISLAFRCGLFNIGVEGQYLMAQVAAAWAGYSLVLPWGVHHAVAILAGAAAGALWAMIPGILKAYRGVHEVINSIMLNYTALYLTQYLLAYHMKEAPGKPSTPALRETATFLQGMIEGSRLHAGLWIALIMAVLVWAFLFKTPVGYEIRAVGLSPGAAEYAGISVNKNIVLAMALSGALAGMAGAVQTMGVMGKFYETSSFVGFGFDGIAVALVGRTHPVGVVLAAFLFGSLERGGPMMQAVAGVPKAVTMIVQGTVIFFVAAEGIWRFMRNRKIKEVKSA